MARTYHSAFKPLDLGARFSVQSNGNAMGHPGTSYRRNPSAPETRLVFTIVDVALITMGILALIGAVVLLSVGHEVPTWLVGIALSTAGYYSGALRHA